MSDISRLFTSACNTHHVAPLIQCQLLLSAYPTRGRHTGPATLSHGKEMYTEILPEHLKKALFQFRIGTYILPVNNRKQLDVSRSERICRICDEGVIGDEIHFLFECPKLEDLRIKYMTLGDRMRPNVYNFVHMLQDNDLGTIYSLAKFVFYGLKLYVRCSV